MKHILIGTFSLLLTNSIVVGQTTNQQYAERINSLQQNIRTIFYDSVAQYYKEFNQTNSNDKKIDSYLWPLCALIQSANETEALALQQITVKKVLNSIQAYKDSSPPLPGYNASIVKLKKEDRFYDDNQWIAIACLDAYERTKDQEFLTEGKRLYDFMMTGHDTIAGGGLYWKEKDYTTKNTCSNGPGIIVALQLYKATKEKKYWQTALQLFNWTQKTLQSPQRIYFDLIRLPTRTIDSAFYTYNTGTMLQANVLFYEITKEKKYLKEAIILADAAYAHFFKQGRYPNHIWFNAVLLRGYLALHKHHQSIVFINAFTKDAEAIWNEERDKQNLIGTKPKKGLIDQAALLEIYARLLKFWKYERSTDRKN
jgi:predicted alpha-1,6-mannanase (GH76 family)